MLRPTATIKEAIQIINQGQRQIALIVNDSGKLLGTVTDGDVRRALLKNFPLESVVEKIMCTQPTVAQQSDSKKEIYQKAISNKLRQIPIVNENQQVIGIEETSEFLNSFTHTHKVVLMVGGLGKRLRPLTNSVPKPMLQIGSKPILQTIVENFARYGFKDILMCVNYKSHIIQDYFGDGHHFGVEIEYLLEKERMGTAGALSLIQHGIKEPFFVMNGDLLTNVNFEQLMDYHTSQRASATMCVREYDLQVPYGIVKLEENKIVTIEEKPVQQFFVNAGIYVLHPDCLSQIPPDEFFDMPTLFSKLIENQQKVLSFPIREYWLDIGHMNDFEKANADFYEVFNP